MTFGDMKQAYTGKHAQEGKKLKVVRKNVKLKQQFFSANNSQSSGMQLKFNATSTKNELASRKPLFPADFFGIVKRK
jgi:hypothetical protein